MKKFVNSTYFKGQLDNGYDYFGVHLLRNEQGEVEATQWRVYAPHALNVFLVGDANYWTQNEIALQKDGDGTWEVTLPGSYLGMLYKYQIIGPNGTSVLKTDPYGYQCEHRPGTASRVCDLSGYPWHDKKYLKAKKPVYDQPVNIYEMHFGSWDRPEHGEFLQFRATADRLISYLEANHFTHVEFLPLYEHPLDMSWGYQSGSYYAITARYGSPQDLMFLIDKLHQHGIGVILDFVMGHIIKDSSYLSNFDGTYLYEYEDQFRRENFVWGTANLDFGKGITRSYMRSAFHFYCEYYHVDGFRIDAVSNLLYYLGNKDNGENKEAIRFIQDLTTSLFAKDNTLIFSAEDSTAFNKVTGKVSDGAVGFNYKWNMGYMNDTLKYFALDPIYRKFHHHLLTFASVYNWSENFIMPFSHDEVVHMKGSLINKMPGNYQDKFSQLKLLMLYFYTFPGKKLLFMGGEFGQFDEWHYESALSWSCLRYESHQQYNQYFRDLTKLYVSSPQLYALDHERKGFRWIDADDVQRSIYSYLRFSQDEQDPYLVILNMTPVGYEHFGQGVPYDGVWEVIFDGTKSCYYGYGQNISLPITATCELTVGQPYRLTFDLRPFACLIFRRVHA